MNRLAVLAVAALIAVVGWASPASADPAGPTDYRSEVTSVEPSTPEVAVRIVGGDSFVVLDVDPGTEVLVVGYRGEPYLRFEADGTVRQNERSPSRWQNDDRYGTSEVPPEATPDAIPDWVVVATDGSYAWHDHRTHWMNPGRPIGAEPGDTILEAVIPLVVDGDEVAVAVSSTLLPAPSPAPLAIGLGAGVAAGGAALAAGLRRRRPGGGPAATAARPGSLQLGPLMVTTGVVAATAAAFGWWAYRSVPAETGPSPLLWLLPAVALVVIAGAATATRRRLLAPPLGLLATAAAVAVAGMELALWSWIRRHALVRALIPSDAPATIDRVVIAAAAVLGVIAVVAAGVAVVGSTIRAPRPAPRHR
ncbi:MAG: hypothetical protein ACFCVK_23755 [Acidimicrobiales bacterium]